jgi:hypothetical protein
MRAPVRADGEFELTVKPLDLVEFHLIFAPVALLDGERLSLDDQVAQSVIADEHVHRIGQACTGGRRN